MEKETRCLHNSTHFDVREANDALYIEGYFSVFNSPYYMWDGAIETVDPHAFDETIGDDIRCLINHDSSLVLGRTKARTLELRIDDKGLWGKVEINPKDQDALNLYERVKRGDVDQCSFGFEILEEEVEFGENDSVHWTLTKVRLFEVSIVTFPAYEDTSVEARKRDFEALKERKAQEELERVKTWQMELRNKLKGETNGSENIDAPEIN